MLNTDQLKLDIGCGPYKESKFLGLDFVKTKETDIVADSENLPIKEGCFNYVFSRRCIQHVKSDSRAFKEIHRMLKAHGKFELIVSSIYGYLFYKFGLSQSRGKYKVFHLYLQNKLKNRLKEAGFLNIKITKVKSTRKIGYDFRAICEK